MVNNLISSEDQIFIENSVKFNIFEKKLVKLNILFSLSSILLLFLLIFKVIGVFISINGTYFYELSSNSNYIVGTSIIFTVISYISLILQYIILASSFVLSVWLFFVAKNNGYEGWVVFASAVGFISAITSLVLSLFELFFSPFTSSFSICILLLFVTASFYLKSIKKIKNVNNYHIILIKKEGN